MFQHQLFQLMFQHQSLQLMFQLQLFQLQLFQLQLPDTMLMEFGEFTIMMETTKQTSSSSSMLRLEPTLLKSMSLVQLPTTKPESMSLDPPSLKRTMDHGPWLTTMEMENQTSFSLRPPTAEPTLLKSMSLLQLLDTKPESMSLDLPSQCNRRSLETHRLGW
jgi:hypothetical protein